MGEVVGFDDAKAARYIERALFTFLGDPPDSDFQYGYLAALLTAYREGLGKGMTDDRIGLLEKMLMGSANDPR